jgi:predicted DNA-binding transcriptional regulator AlpA
MVSETSTPEVGESLNEEFIDRSDLARRLGVHERTIRRMVARGELPRPCVGTGGRPRWLWSFVLEHCRKQHYNAVRLDGKVKTKLK